jgi:integrase
MATGFLSTGVQGIRYREHKTRRHGIKKDRYFVIRFQSKGKRVEESLGWASQGWTLQKAQEVLAELKKGARTGEGPVRLKEKRELAETQAQIAKEKLEKEKRESIILDDFFDEVYFPGRQLITKKGTWNTEKSIYNRWLRMNIGKLSVGKLTLRDVEKIRDIQIKAKLSPKSIKDTVALIRQICKRFEIYYNIKFKNLPTKEIKIPKVNNERHKFLKHKQAKDLLKELKKRSDITYELALFSLCTGARASEIFNLKWNCVDFKNKTILLTETKNGKNRYIYMIDKVYDLLKIKNKNTEYVFLNRNNKKINRISKTFSRVVNELELNKTAKDRYDKICFHTLRHTFASWQVQSGASLYVLANLLGHSELKMTQRYAHLAKNNMQDAMQNYQENLNF